MIKRLLASIVLLLVLISCKDKKTTPKNDYLNVNTTLSEIKWTGYKFNTKKPVSGVFKEMNVLHQATSKNIKYALNGLEIAVPVSSIFSKNESRDQKLKNILFGSMKNTNFIKGRITKLNNNSGLIAFTLNGETHEVRFTYTTKDQTAYLKTAVNFELWNALESVNKLNEACKLLHTGPNGKSLTWQTTDLDIKLVFEKS